MPARWRRCGQRALRRLPGAAFVAMVLVAPAVCALGDLLPCSAAPSTAHALLSAAMLTAAKGSAAGAGVSDAPSWVPRGRRASIEASKVAGKGTPLPGGALWAHFRKLGGHWSQLCNVAQNTPEVIL